MLSSRGFDDYKPSRLDLASSLYEAGTRREHAVHQAQLTGDIDEKATKAPTP